MTRYYQKGNPNTQFEVVRRDERKYVLRIVESPVPSRVGQEVTVSAGDFEHMAEVVKS